ncbi:VOC family protein [Actinoplanes sp. NPDC048796]|uniref:VOC family protein n=1 Tax=unclassified Actinoplanes TaxID=2626549 RepID=UPI00340B3EEC
MTESTPPSPQYDGIFTPWLAVTDMDRSIEWYQRVLGFEIEFRADDKVGWCEFVTPTKDVYLGLYRMPGVAPGGGAMPTFGVRDLAAERARLTEMGVRIQGPDQVIPDLISFLTFLDPDGNALMFCQVLHEPRH